METATVIYFSVMGGFALFYWALVYLDCRRNKKGMLSIFKKDETGEL